MPAGIFSNCAGGNFVMSILGSKPGSAADIFSASIVSAGGDFRTEVFSTDGEKLQRYMKSVYSAFTCSWSLPR